MQLPNKPVILANEAVIAMQLPNKAVILAKPESP